MKVPLGITTLHLSQRSALLLLLAVGLIGFGSYDYVQQSQAITNAVAVEATVTAASVDRIDDRRGIDYAPDIEYRYQYQGETYTNAHVFPSTGTRTYSDRSKAQSIVDSYAPGSTVRAYITPSDPSDAFLIRERTPWPLRAVTIGSVLLVIAVWSGLGAQTPGRQELRPSNQARSVQSLGWFIRHGNTVRWLAKRVAAVCFLAFWLSMVALAFGVLNASDGVGTPSQTIQASLTGPIGGSLLAGAVSWIGLILSLCLYGTWSFTKYRQLRRRLYDPKPPSPFRHPSRLVTILGTSNDELSDYGKRVRVTGWVLLAAVGMTGILANLLITA